MTNLIASKFPPSFLCFQSEFEFHGQSQNPQTAASRLGSVALAPSSIEGGLNNSTNEVTYFADKRIKRTQSSLYGFIKNCILFLTNVP
ncbi:MAG: hypothetical protein KA407_02635 [Spirochaetes bacterium]|nr:hypothetical protein [Spirochaetota bacterium]